jgi:orotidine-5'-phosphate decarboxylase
MAATPAHFSDLLAESVLARRSVVCVGLDPVLDRIPPQLRDAWRARLPEIGEEAAAAGCLEEFCLGILEAVADVAACVKPQAAFFEQYGAPGWTALRNLVAAAHERGLPVILDVKRGDIASTGVAYARAAFGGAAGLAAPVAGLDADAVTVSPYLGEDSLTPFTAFCDQGRGVFVLTRTSNPGAAAFQEQEIAGRALYLHVAQQVARLGAGSRGAHGYSDVGAVAGATSPAALRAVRGVLPDAFLLVPGYGAQGGDADAIAGIASGPAAGYVVNASRTVLYAWQLVGGDYREAAAQTATAMRQELAFRT